MTLHFASRRCFTLLLVASYIAIAWNSRMASAAPLAPVTLPIQPATRPAIAPAPRPTVPIDAQSCVTPECHVAVKAYKTIHAPITMNACDSCHKVADIKRHTFEIKRKNADLCTYCHDFNVENIPVVHAPVAKGECLGCHNPHGGVDKRFIRENSMQEMCARCHDAVTQNKKNVHDPVAKGACDSCHTSHASRFPKLLFNEGEALCYTCHKDTQAQLANVRFPHQAMKDGCGKCHEAHASNNAKQLKQPVVTLCTTTCHDHDKIATQITQSKYKHTVVTKDAACMTCHLPHGSNFTSLMIDTPLTLCMKCHNDKTKTDRGYVVPAMPELSDETASRHGPVNDGECGACHQSHGSDQKLLLVRANNNTFYQSLAADNYQLCFSCHDLRLAKDEKTASATQFRNGAENLHALHVNRGERGRNCRVCHATHASHNPRHVNQAVRFGQWEMPIRFKMTETGGSCDTGCHPDYPYDRVRPATRPTTRASTRPTTWPSGDPAIPIASHSTTPVPETLKLTLKTVAGQEIGIPNALRPTVLLFTRADHSQQPELIRLVSSAIPQPNLAQVILIIGGQNADREAARLNQSRRLPWPIVLDPSEELFTQLQVHVWPTTLILRSDGSQVARLSGVPESLSLAIAAQTEFASGKIDRATLTQRLTAKAVAGDTPARKLARELQAAQKLAASDKPEQARKLLTDLLANDPANSAIKLELLKVLTQLGLPDRALNLLDQIPAGILPPGQREILRARLYIETAEWNPAAKAVAAALAQNPQSSEAHYLRGRLHEQNGDWKSAASEYRMAQELGAR